MDGNKYSIGFPFIQDRGGESSNSHVQKSSHLGALAFSSYRHYHTVRVKLIKELFNAISAMQSRTVVFSRITELVLHVILTEQNSQCHTNMNKNKNTGACSGTNDTARRANAVGPRSTVIHIMFQLSQHFSLKHK